MAYRIIIEGTGPSGQDRQAGNGADVDFNSGGIGTPDFIAMRAVNYLRGKGLGVTLATITHTEGETTVTDNLETGKRSGQFPQP